MDFLLSTFRVAKKRSTTGLQTFTLVVILDFFNRANCLMATLDAVFHINFGCSEMRYIESIWMVWKCSMNWSMSLNLNYMSLMLNIFYWFHARTSFQQLTQEIFHSENRCWEANKLDPSQWSFFQTVTWFVKQFRQAFDCRDI